MKKKNQTGRKAHRRAQRGGAGRVWHRPDDHAGPDQPRVIPTVPAADGPQPRARDSGRDRGPEAPVWHLEQHGERGLADGLVRRDGTGTGKI